MCDLCFIPRCDCDAVATEESGFVSAPLASTVISVRDTAAPTADIALGLDSTTRWTGTTVTYGFPATPQEFTNGVGFYSSYNEPGSMLSLSAFGRDTLREGFAQWEALTTLTITEAAPTVAQINVGASTTPSTAWAYYPGTARVNGDIWFNTSQWYLDALSGPAEPVIGSYAYATGMHEFGHALGLKHPHQASGGGTVIVPAAYDAVEFSIMSYRSYPGGPASAYTMETWGYPQSPMMLDIAMIQRIYGADYTTQAGNTTYTVSTTTGEMFVDGVSLGVPGANRVFRTIWDGNGTDHIDLSNYTTSMYADLNPGRGIEFDTVGTFQAARLATGIYAGFNIYMSMLHQNDTRSLIENLTTGSGNDILIGNAAANVLTSAAGTNTFTGGAGADRLVLGSGADTVTDTLAGLNGDTILNFDWAQDTLVVQGALLAADRMTINPVGNLLIDVNGDGTPETTIAMGLTGGLQANAVRAGNDTVVTFTPAPIIPTPDLALNLNGAWANDVLTGAGGNDTILMRYGNDTATGNAGADTFIFDWRYVWTGDRHVVTDLDFAEGDRFMVRFFEGQNFIVSSVADLTAFMARPEVTASSTATGLDLRVQDSTGTALEFTLNGLQALLAQDVPDPDMNLNGGWADDVLTGGSGDDMILMRYGNDTATGNAGADTFLFDWRYVRTGDDHVVTDLDFAEGDQLLVRFFEGRNILVSNADDLAAFIARPEVTASSTATGLDVRVQDSTGNALDFTLNGIGLDAVWSNGDYFLV